MTKEAVNHVKEAELTVAKIRENANENIRAIQSRKEDEIAIINQELQNQLQAFKKEQRQKFEEGLASKREQNKQLVKEEAEKYKASYSRIQEELSNHIVREVLKRYGD